MSIGTVILELRGMLLNVYMPCMALEYLHGGLLCRVMWLLGSAVLFLMGGGLPVRLQIAWFRLALACNLYNYIAVQLQ